MGRTQKLSEFWCGTVIEFHLWNKSREISWLLNIPQSTVNWIIKTWKCLGTTETQTRSGRPRPQKLGSVYADGHTVVSIVCKLSAEELTPELQTSCGLQISSRTVCRELHWMRFYDQAAAFKPHITKCNAKHWMHVCSKHTREIEMRSVERHIAILHLAIW